MNEHKKTELQKDQMEPVKYSREQVLEALRNPTTQCSIRLPTKTWWSDDKFVNRLTINGIDVEFEENILEILDELNKR